MPKIVSLESGDAEAAARLAAQSLPEAWPEEGIVSMLVSGGIGWKIGAVPIEAFLLARITVDEAEILTLVVDGAMRRRGYGRALLDKALGYFAERGVRQVFLEFRASNVAARTIYEQAGFIESGRRRGYYRSLDSPDDAVTMQRVLEPRGLTAHALPRLLN